MRAAAIGLVVGACWLQSSAVLPALQVILALSGLAAVLLWLARVRPSLSAPLLLCAGVAAGFAWSAYVAQERLAVALPASLEGKDIRISGVVESLPARFERGTRFLFRVEQQPGGVPPHIALSWYAGEEGGPGLQALKPGERWQLLVRLRRPHGNANPYGFDYESWLLEQDIRATGYVRPAGTVNQRLQDFVPGARVLVERVRDWLRTRMQAALQGKPYAGILVALVIGDQRDITPGDA